MNSSQEHSLSIPGGNSADRSPGQKSKSPTLQTTAQKKQSAEKKDVFVTGVMAGKEGKKSDDYPERAAIKQMHKELMFNLDNMDKNIEKLLSNHEKDFLTAYNNQMFNVQKELKQLKKKIDEETLKRKSDERMNILEEERDWFRAEAIRLDKICKEQQKMISDLQFKLKILNEEKTYYEEFILEAKKENKTLKEELFHADAPQGQRRDLISAGNFSQNKSTTNFMATRSNFRAMNRTVRSEQQFKNVPGDVNDNQIQNQADTLPDRGILTVDPEAVEIINQLKSELEKERKINRQLKSEKASYIIHRQELEQILVEGISEVKKDIAKRKAMMGLREFQKGPELPEEIDFSKFSVSDKKRVLEFFLSNEYVMDEVYNMVFAHGPQSPKTAGSQMQQRAGSSGIGSREFQQRYTFSYGFDPANPNTKIKVGKNVSATVSDYSTKTRALLQDLRKKHL